MSRNHHRQPGFDPPGRPAPLSRTELHVVTRSADANRNIDSEPPTAPEPFVTAKEAARFLCLSVRRLLEMARVGLRTGSAGVTPVSDLPLMVVVTAFGVIRDSPFGHGVASR